MASAKATIGLEVSPDDVWQLIGGFDSLPEWLPYIVRSELTDGGQVRHLDNSDGQTIVERLEKYDSSARTYSYSVLQARMGEIREIQRLSLSETEDRRRPLHTTRSDPRDRVLHRT